MRMPRRAPLMALLFTLLAAFAGFAPAHAGPPAPFRQCPGVGADTSCAILIVFNADGSVTTYEDPTQGPFDGIEDTLVGVQNDMTRSAPSVDLTSTTIAFGFDADGLCGYSAPGCPFGPTFYEGPNTSFSNISADVMSGTVNFTGGLAAGGSAYFSLEDRITAGNIVGHIPCPAGATMSTAITRPTDGHIYVGDVDRGASGDGTTVVAGVPITLAASTSNLANTASVEFFVDGVSVGIDTTSPFEVTASPSLAAGPHLVSVSAPQVDDRACIASDSLVFHVVDPAAKAETRNIVQNNIPAELHLLAGGLRAEGKTGQDSIKVVDQPIAAAAGSVGAFHDSVSISTTSDVVGESDALVSNVSLLSGLVTATSLHAHAKALYNTTTLSGSTSDAGSAIEELMIGGTPVSVSQPNTKVTLPNGLGTVVLQEVVLTGTATAPEITVNALHAYLDTPSIKGELILGSAFAGANFIADHFAGPGDLIHVPNDDGTYADAGDSPPNAQPISQGAFGAGFTPHDDADWYAFDAGQGDRILLSVTPSQQQNVGVSALPKAPGSLLEVSPFVAGVVAAIHSSTTFKQAEVHLFDPSGLERFKTFSDSGLTTAIDFNADLPFNGKGRWLLEVRRVMTGSGESPDAFYTVGFGLPPVQLLSDDAGGPGDAPNDCSTARPVALSPTGTTSARGVVGSFRDGDVTDAISFTAKATQHQFLVIKADELAGTAIHADLFGPSSCMWTVWQGSLAAGGQGQSGTAQVDLDKVVPADGLYTLVLTREHYGIRYGAGNWYTGIVQRDLIRGQ